MSKKENLFIKFKTLLDNMRNLITTQNNEYCFVRAKTSLQRQKGKETNKVKLIPLSKCIISNDFKDKALRILIRQDYCPNNYLNSNYRGIIYSKPKSKYKYYEFMGDVELIVKKNVRIENHIKNALEEKGFINEMSVSRYVSDEINNALGSFLPLYENQVLLCNKITIYLSMRQYLSILYAMRGRTHNFSKFLRSILYRSLGFVQTAEINQEPRKDVA